MVSREEARAKLKPTFVEKDVDGFGKLSIRRLSWRAALRIDSIRAKQEPDAQARWTATWITETVYGADGLPIFGEADVSALMEADSDTTSPLWRAVADVNVLDAEAEAKVGEASAATS